MTDELTRHTQIVRVRPGVAADWLLRTLLPALLPAAGHRTRAAELAEGVPLSAGWELRNPYVVSRLAFTLRELRARLLADLLVERRWSRELAAGSTLEQWGGPVRFRSVFLPHLDELTGFVAAAVPARGVGGLLRECVELTIDLIVTARDNDRTDVAPSSTGLERLQVAYERALVDLAARCPDTTAVAPVVAVEEARRESNSQKGFRGVVTAAGETVRCPHVHHTARLAQECAHRLSNRDGVAA